MENPRGSTGNRTDVDGTAPGLSTPEIAAALGDTTGAVKIRLHRARKALLSRLQSACSFSHDERGTLVCEPDK